MGACRNGAYEKFLFDYAQVEDQIRKLWVQLMHDQQTLLARTYLTMLYLVQPNPSALFIQDISKERQKASQRNDSEREKGQVKGLAIAKKAVEGKMTGQTCNPAGTLIISHRFLRRHIVLGTLICISSMTTFNEGGHCVVVVNQDFYFKFYGDSTLIYSEIIRRLVHERINISN